MNGTLFTGLTRRESIMSLSAAGLAALACQTTSDAKKNTVGKKAKQKCKRQEGPCTTLLTDICLGEPEVCLPFVLCCSHLASCNVSEFMSCFFRLDEA